MTKIVLTWQEDEDHDKPYSEILEMEGEDKEKTKSSTAIPEVVSLDSTKISLFGRVTMSIALDDCIQELSILKYIINEPINEAWEELYKYEAPDERFTFSTPRKKKAFQEEQYENIPFTENQKLLRDVCLVLTTLRGSARDLLQQGHYHTISNVLQAIKTHHEQSNMIEEKYKMNTKELKTLNNRYRKEKKEFTTAIEQAKICIHELENEYQDVLSYGKLELRYTDEWERARQDQQDLQSKQAEADYTNTIDNYMVKIEYENRIHTELQTFIDENTEDMQNDIAYWMGYYDVEMERLEDLIIKTRLKWQGLVEDHQKLSEKYLDRENFIIERREINERRRQEAELLRIRTQAAIRIQAWWRGMMVRKKLGKYREKKGAKAKKKQDAKKKEKELGKTILLLKQQKGKQKK